MKKEDQLTLIDSGAVIGNIPRSLPQLELKTVIQLLPYALIISLLGFMEAISIAKAMAVKTSQKLGPNQELMKSSDHKGRREKNHDLEGDILT